MNKGSNTKIKIRRDSVHQDLEDTKPIKVAHTVGAARRLGATSQDISQDLVAGALTLL